MRSWYPKASLDRPRPFDPAMKAIRRRCIPAIVKNFLLLQILFLSLFCWAFGSLYQQTTRTHNLTIVFVDYDGGAVGEAFRAAYARLEGSGYPTLVERSPLEFAEPADLGDAVCRTDYWASIYIASEASDRLRGALTGDTAATEYSKTGVVSYTWNEARYPAVVDAAIASSLATLSSTAKMIYTTGNAQGIANATDPAVLSILVEPWQLESVNIQPTTQGSRAIYNTLSIVLILIQEFFYLGTLNGIYGAVKLWIKGKPYIIIIVRLTISLMYTFVGSLCSTGAIWAFRASWDLNGVQFILNWLALWLFAHLNFQVLDVFTIWLPAAYVPMALISWIMLNVTSVLLPFELSPGFFQIGYVFPSHAVYQTLVDIWSRGCNPRLSYSLTTMFAWELVATLLSVLGVYRRCHYAKIAEEAEQAQFQERLDAAVQFERERERELREKGGARKALADPADEDPITAQSSPGEGDEESMKSELANVISGVNSRIRRENIRRQSSAGTDFGPTFSLPFRCAEDETDS